MPGMRAYCSVVPHTRPTRVFVRLVAPDASFRHRCGGVYEVCLYPSIGQDGEQRTPLLVFGVVTFETQQLTGNGVNRYLDVGKEGGPSLRRRMAR